MSKSLLLYVHGAWKSSSGLRPEEIRAIVMRRLESKCIEDKAVDVIAHYATNGRKAVNIVQIAAGLIMTAGKSAITATEVEGQTQASINRARKRIPDQPQVGFVNGWRLRPQSRHLIEAEASAIPTEVEQVN